MKETEEMRKERHKKGLIAQPTKCLSCGTVHTEEDANIVVHGTMTIFHVACKTCSTRFRLRKLGKKGANW